MVSDFHSGLPFHWNGSTYDTVNPKPVAHLFAVARGLGGLVPGCDPTCALGDDTVCGNLESTRSGRSLVSEEAYSTPASMFRADPGQVTYPFPLFVSL